MSSTLPDVSLVGSGYQDIYAATGIAVGNPLIIQNKSSGSIYIQEQSTQPVSTSTAGFLLLTNQACVVYQGSPGCWANTQSGTAKLCVQLLPS